MSDDQQTVRIFISSPGDVTEERDGAHRVIEGLQRLYRRASLQPLLWEELALPATASFQETIDYLLESQPIDIAVFMLWSRLGSPLGPSVTRADGTAYRSGTEREFDLMLAAFEQSGCKRPTILVYVRDDDAAFRKKITNCPPEQLEELIYQRKLAESFIREKFHDEEGHNVRAFHTYREPVGFAQRLRLHLRQAIDDFLQGDATPTWLEEPYRGLETFDVEHAPIFYGREEETCQLLQRVRDQEQSGCTFVVIVGASGSGKSSLARAGVAANLVHYAIDDAAVQWYSLTFVPALAADDLIASLVRSIAQYLPQCKEASRNLDALAKGLSEDPTLAVRMGVAPAFSQASENAGRTVRLLIILDQLEELWTDRLATERNRERFLAAIDALARSGHVAVLATLRSDFYAIAQETPLFLQLKGERGHYDLLPPDTAAIQRLITEPARLSGLSFERNEQTGRSLDEVILEDAARDPNALPLLEFTLSELYRRRDETRSLLSFAAYAELGGVEGSIGKRAEETFANLPPDAQDSLEEILPLLVSVDVAGEHAAVRRRANMSELTLTPGRRTLVESLIAARLLTTDYQDEIPIASLTHEALLRRWSRNASWIDINREQLRLRARVEQSQQRWGQQGREDSLLLGEGLPLNEGRRLLDEAPYLLTESVKEYIDTSIAQYERIARQTRRVRTIVVSTISALLLLLIVGGVIMRRINAQETRSAEASGLIKRLLQVEPSDLQSVLTDLDSYRDLTRDDLNAVYETSDVTSKAKLHAALAMLDEDDSVLPFLEERLLDVKPDEFQYVRDLLKSHKDDLINDYWGIVTNRGQDRDRRFHAACALAAWDPGNDHWQDEAISRFIADHLVGVQPSELLPWRNALTAVRSYLTPRLEAVFRDVNNDAQVRGFATDILADYLSDDTDALFNLLADANEKQFGPIYDKLLAHKERAIELGNVEVAKTPAEGANEEDLEALAMRQANAAVMLLRMDAPNQVWPLLIHSPDSRARSYIIHWLSPRGGDAASIIAHYKQESDVTIKRALLLSLGEFKFEQDEKEPLIETLLKVYRSDPDAGLHAAAEWLLRRCGQGENLAAVDAELQQNDEQLVADKDDPRQWYVNTQGQTFVIRDAGEFWIGSPETEASHQSDETLHRMRIGRRIAIATKEVTHEQWRVFSQANPEMGWKSDQEPLKAYIRSDDSPMVGMVWYESAWYCNWLSQQEGIPEVQWCYEKNEEGQYGPGMKAKEGFWELNGYRLPTDAEWEYACRAGVRSSRYYGVTEALLPRYAWYQANADRHTHPVASLKPNDYGLFDMYGNVYEWCYDAYGGNPPASTEDAVIDMPPTESVENSVRRVLRGGGASTRPQGVRSANRINDPPDERSGTYGFRPARTYPKFP